MQENIPIAARTKRPELATTPSELIVSDVRRARGGQGTNVNTRVLTGDPTVRVHRVHPLSHYQSQMFAPLTPDDHVAVITRC